MSALIHPQKMPIEGLSIRFAESGTGSQHALLLSPWPESLFAFEQMWSRLAEVAHVIAVDLPGFGGSERREALMNPKAMGEFIVRIADAFGLDKPHVVAPDIGTSATLFAAAAHPGRFASVVVGTGGAAVPLILRDPLKEWVEATDLEPYRQIGGRKIVEIALEHHRGIHAVRRDTRRLYRLLRRGQVCRHHPLRPGLSGTASAPWHAASRNPYTGAHRPRQRGPGRASGKCPLPR